MKCFYCNATVDESNLNCMLCSRELGKVCEKCGIIFEGSANFCMSCGGKLIIRQIHPAHEEISVIEEPEDIIVINTTEDFQVQEEPFIEPVPEPVLPAADKKDHDIIVLDESAEIVDDRLKDIGLEIDDMIIESPEAPVETKSKISNKIKQKSSVPQHKEAPPPDFNAVRFAIKSDELMETNAADSDFEAVEPVILENTPPVEMKTKGPLIFSNQDSLEVAMEDDPAKNRQSTTVDDNEDLPLQAKEIQIRDTSKELKPFLNGLKQEVSLQDLSDYIVNKVSEPVCKQLFSDIAAKLSAGEGGIYFLEGEAGVGKSYIAKLIDEHVKANPPKDVSVAVSAANAFDFDYMIFIHLIKNLMHIKSNDMAAVRKKFDKYFGDTLPKNKIECLVALLCLNFVPLKIKLPKNDIEYLLSYIIYWLAKNKPILWVIDNAGYLNLRSVKFFKNLKRIFKHVPVTVVFVSDTKSQITSIADNDERYVLKGFGDDELMIKVRDYLNTAKVPADVEKVLKKSNGSMLFVSEVLQLLKGRGFIFEMKGSWRFSKLPDDFVCPENLNDLIAARFNLLDTKLHSLLRKIVLLNLFDLPKTLFNIVLSGSEQDIDALVEKGYLVKDEDSYRFSSRALLNSLRNSVKIENAERQFYREVVLRLSSANTEIQQLNRHWLLLSYINLGGIVDKRFNSFLFSSAIYMEKLGFFEIAQRCYQTIISSFGNEEEHDDFKTYLETKNAKLWSFSQVQWAKISWQKLSEMAERRHLVHLELTAKGELLLLESEKVVIQEVVDVIKQLHLAGCFEDEISFLDRTTELLIESENYHDAHTFALRGFKILRDILNRDSSGHEMIIPDFIYVLYIRTACKLAEVNIFLKNYNYSIEILEEALDLSIRYDLSYFKAKIMLLLGKVKFSGGEDWESLIEEGFYQAISGMDFVIIKSFFVFFEENGLEDRKWLQPFLEYKNWINF